MYDFTLNPIVYHTKSHGGCGGQAREGSYFKMSHTRFSTVIYNNLFYGKFV